MRRRRPRNRSEGFTLIELLVVIVIMATALSMMSNTVVTVGRLQPVSEESIRALDAARSLAEELRGVPYREIFARYNDDPADDPGGPGTAPGADFAVDGLDPRPGDPDGRVGRIVFPVVAGQLREDFVDAELGLPRDLNLDGAVDANDHAGDYEILPFHVRLEWRGRNGDRSYDVCSALVRP